MSCTVSPHLRAATCRSGWRSSSSINVVYKLLFCQLTCNTINVTYILCTNSHPSSAFPHRLHRPHSRCDVSTPADCSSSSIAPCSCPPLSPRNPFPSQFTAYPVFCLAPSPKPVNVSPCFQNASSSSAAVSTNSARLAFPQLECRPTFSAATPVNPSDQKPRVVPLSQRLCRQRKLEESLSGSLA